MYLDGCYFTVDNMLTVSGDKLVRAAIAAHSYKVE